MRSTSKKTQKVSEWSTSTSCNILNLLYEHVDENDEKPCPVQVRIYAYDYCSEG